MKFKRSILLSIFLSLIITNLSWGEKMSYFHPSIFVPNDFEEEITQEDIVVEEEKIDIIEFNIQGFILREGVSNEEVLRVKRFLNMKYSLNIEENYYFDRNTKDLIINFQREKGLETDGIIGPHTYTAINKDMEINNLVVPQMEMKIENEIPRDIWIIINKSSNTLYHMKENLIIKKYPVATGKSPDFTPEGKFTIITKFINPYWGGAGIYKPVKGGAPNNPLGKRWMGLNIKEGGSYGIHGNSDKNSIGRYISLGCIRMYNKDVEYIYELLPKNTPIWIGREEKLREYGIVFNLNEISQWEN